MDNEQQIYGIKGSEQWAIDRMKKVKTLYTKLDHVSKSGLTRKITVLDIDGGEPSYWNYYIAKILNYKLDENGSLIVRGTGMDMGFDIVYKLSQVLHNDSYKIKHRWI
tara:strand:- start:228 stop:551 length:324 start_codon:yes stop_codon:yes gene_type:complete